MNAHNQSITIARALHQATQRLRGISDTARLDAELLLAHALGWRRTQVLAEGHEELGQAQLASFQALVERRAARVPVAYLTGSKEFYGLELYVDQRVLVPRPETELLVERALEHARARQGTGPLLIADVGTGSGCIAVALAANLPRARVYATDISPAALEVAARNAARHQVAGRVTLLQGDLLAPLPEPVDLLVSNPPYTILAEVDEGVRQHEPHLALDGGPDGLDLYRRLLAAAPAYVRSGGALLLEIGAWQGAAVAALARAHFPGADVLVHRDLAGRDRVVSIVPAP